MLRARQLSISRGKQMVLRDVDLSLAPGELLGVLGPNGAGKSTLLNLLSGELSPDTGEIWLGGRLLADWSGIQRARRLAVLPQSSTLSFAFPVAEVVGMGRMPHATGQLYDAQVVAEVLQAADAAHLAARSYLQLSGGERQRVHLARVLAQLWPGDTGQTLLLDEPTSMLDPLHQHSTLQAVRRFAEQGGAAMVILHDLNLAARYCDRLLLLNAGVVHACGRPEEVLRAQPLQQVFGLEVLIQRHPERGHPLIVTR